MITVIGRLHFLVKSNSRQEVEHTVDLEPQDGDPYFCSCEAFEKHPDHHGKPCRHMRQVVEHIQKGGMN